MADVAYPDLGINSDIGFFEQIVCADMNAFAANKGKRETFHLASSLNHMLDWHWHSLNPGRSNRKKGQKDWERFRDDSESRCSALKLIRDLCDASKHCGLDRENVQLTKAEVITGRGGHGNYGVGNFGYNVAGAYGSGIPEPRLHSSGNNAAWCSDLFDGAFAYWESIIMPRKLNGLTPP